MANMMQIGLGYYLDSAGYSITDLADKIGMSYSGLYYALRNETLKVKTLKKIAEVLEVSPCEILMGGDPNPGDGYYHLEDFTANKQLHILAQRYDKFSDKLSFYKDYFFWTIFSDLHKATVTYTMFNPGGYLITKKEKEKLEDLLLFAGYQNSAYSCLPKDIQTEIKKFDSIFRVFYFSIFLSGFLSLREYILDGLIKDEEILKYWKAFNEGW